MNYQEMIKEAIEALEIQSPTVFSWFGRVSEDQSHPVTSSVAPESKRRSLHQALKMRLYQDFYCSGRSRPTGSDGMEPPEQKTPFAQALSQANQGQGYWSQGWQIQDDFSASASSHPKIIVKRQGLSLQVTPQEYQPAASHSERPQGMVRFPKEFWGMSPGHYMALSDVELCPRSLQELVRLYWNVTPDGAIPLMTEVTTLLNQEKIPFRFKVLNNPNKFAARCDTAVLYFHRDQFDLLAGCLQHSIYGKVAPYLNAHIPALTKPLALGLSLAEEPGNGESFGLHRCSILAEGLIQAHEQHLTRVSDRLAVVNSQFQSLGLSLEAPYLQADSQCPYEVVLTPYHSQTTPEQVSWSVTDPHPDRFLKTAEDIAAKICQDAIWDQNQCTWLGAEANTLNRSSSLSQLTHRALGPELYDGTSGIALFLAELSIMAHDPKFRRTAIGAIHQALSQLEICPPMFQRGFYSGWIGVAVAAARIGTLLEQPDLLISAIDLVRHCANESERDPHFDLVSGTAGGIAGLLILETLLPPQVGCLALAQRWGDELIGQGRKGRHGFSWQSPTQSGKTDLAGWSHGTSGAAFALLELYQATRTEKFRQIAEQALAYERHWFNPDMGNWPDLRQVNRRQKALPYMSAWCHGAPGIALSRLQASALLDRPQYHQEAIAALNTTRDSLAGGGKLSNFSLCHGLAGNMEILLLGSQQLGKDLGEDWDESRGVVEAIADKGRVQYGDNHQWPCGVQGRGETPNLMLGFAGIGYFYLRLHNPEIPSILIPQASTFAASNLSAPNILINAVA